MKKRRIVVQKTISLLSGGLLILQSLFPSISILYSTQAFAQEATTSATETPAPTPVTTPEPTIEPTNTPTQEQTPTPQPTETVTPTPTEEVTPTIEPTPTPPETTPTEAPKNNSPPADDSQGEILDGVSTVAPTQAPPTPTITPVQPETGELSATILENISAPTLDLDGVNPDGSASLSTDKADYAPTDTAIITGTNFTPGKSYTLIVSSSDEPPVHFETIITANDSGAFMYAYQLDGNYRPNYKVEAKNQEGETITVITFTDSISYTVESYSDNTYVTVKNNFLQTETVYGKGTRNSSGNIRLRFRNPSNTIVKTCDPVNGTVTTCFYNLPADAPLGEWDIQIQKEHLGVWILEKTDHFYVTVNWPTTWTTPNSCVTDPAGEPGVSPTEVDLVGNNTTPAVGFYTDANFFYFRERVTGNPGTVDDLSNYSWVVLFQTTSPQYQYLGAISGKSGNKVLLYGNPTHAPDAGGVDFSPLFNDPADNPILWEGPSTAYGRVTGSGPFYIDWAIPISELTSRGINISTTKFFATSTNANNYNKDHLKCYETMSDLSIIKSDSPDPVTSGGTLTYTLSIHNAGPDTASGVVVTDTLPTGYSVTSVTPSQGNCSDTTGSSIQCELGSMANGADATVTIVGLMTGSGIVTNTASVTLDITVSIDTNQSNNNDSEDTTINPAAVCGDGFINQPTEQCDDGNTSDGDGCNATCQQEGKIIIEKQTLPDGSLQTFAFTPSYGAGFTLMDGQTNSSGFLASGTYSVSETIPTGWSLTNISCNDANSGVSAFAGNTATIIVDAGETVTCTFTNVQLPTLTVNKILSPVGHGFFDLRIDGTTYAHNVGNGGTTGPQVLSVGSHTVSETEGNPSTNLGDYAVTYGGDCESDGTVTLAAGENKTCTITNIAYGSLIIRKDAVPNDPQDFFFTTTGTGLSNFSLDDDGDPTLPSSILFLSLTPGTYDVSETAVGGWGLTSATCSDGSPVDAINIAAGENVTCTFTNTKPPTLTLQKIVDNKGTLGDADPSLWFLGITGIGSGRGPTYGPVTVDAGTDYIISEAPGGPEDYSASDWTCDNDITPTNHGTYAVVNLPVGKDVTCSITNTLDTGTLRVQKTVNVPDDLADWEFKLDNGPWIHASDTGVVDFGTVTTGNHTITEKTQTGYYLSSVTGCTPIVANNNSATATVTVDQETTCTFNNYAIPVYTGTNTCPTDAPVKNLINTYTIGAKDADGEMLGLAAGNYLFEATGSFIPTSAAGYVSDAGYTTIHGSLSSQYGIGGIAPDYGAHALLANLGSGVGIVNWGPYNAGHTYSLYISSPANPQFVIGDRYSNWYGTPYDNQSGMSDNSGSLSLNVYECVNYGSISGKKFDDIYGNGLKDVGDPGVAGWTIELYDAPNHFNASTTTDASGNYSFSNLLPGVYKVCEVPQAGWLRTAPASSDCSSEFELHPDENIADLDFGNYNYSRIWGYKFDDDNNNEVWDDGENGLEGWTIYLDLNLNGSLDSEEPSTLTNALGMYEFNNLTRGNYHGGYLIREILQSGWAQTYPKSGSHWVPTTSGSDERKDFGNLKLGSIQGKKFDDKNSNGTRQSGDTWLDGWTINLYSYGDGWSQIKSMQTGDDTTEAGLVDQGQYRFENLSPGNYLVCEEVQDGWMQTGLVGSGGRTPSPSGDGTQCFEISLTAADQLQGFQFGNFKLGKVQGMKYDDVDGDGLPHESGESFMNEWTIRLYQNWEELDEVITSNTDTTGQYRFTNLQPGTYQVCEVINDGWTQTWPKLGDYPIGDNGVVHSDYGQAVENQSGVDDEGSVCWQTVIDRSGDFNQLLRFGNTNYGTITVDKATNPQEDTQLFDFTIEKDATAVDTFSLQDTDTPHTGSYVAGHYTITEATNADWEQGDISCTGGSNLETHLGGTSFDLAAGASVNCTFNNIKYGTVTVTKFNDSDNDGEKDEEEEYLSGWDMTLTDHMQETTNSDGIATFSYVREGTYIVGEVQQPLWKQTHISCVTAHPSPTPTPPELTLDLIENVHAREVPEGSEQITVRPGETVNCLIGNHYSPPLLQISKDNDTAGLDKSPGASILYTLTLKVLDNTAFGVNLVDLLPQGFIYRVGSWTASITGGTFDHSITEPTYASPGTWDLGNLTEGSEVTLTLIADVSNDQKPGIYKDLALAYGCQLEEPCSMVVATAVAPGDIGQANHVGTDVNIVKDIQDSKSINVQREETGTVLGASTELPATGGNALWILIATVFILTGVGSLVIGCRLSRRYHA